MAVWDLSDLASPSATLRPTITTLVPPGDPQLAVKFNVNNPSEFITNGKRRVYFWQLPPRLAGGAMSFYSPPLKASDFSQSVGDFITSTFVPNSSQVGGLNLSLHVQLTALKLGHTDMQAGPR